MMGMPPQEVENPLAHGMSGQDAKGGAPLQGEQRWVVLKEREQEELRDANGNHVFRYANGDAIPLDWCMVMRLPEPKRDEDGFLGEPTAMPDEAREIVERCFNVGLYVKHHIGMEQRQLFIQIGATLPMMMHEATHHMELQMEVKGARPCRGTIPFHVELVHQFQSKEDYEAGKEFRFNSGQRQLIVMNLIERLAQVDPYAKVRSKSRFELLQNCKFKAVHKHHGMQRWAVKELLEANLCTTMTSMQKSTTLKLPKCMKLYNKLLVDAAVEVATQGQANPGERVDPDACKEIVLELEAKTLGESKTVEELMAKIKKQKASRQMNCIRKLFCMAHDGGDDGDEDSFVCRMTHCYPLHDQVELGVLLERWADFQNMKRWEIPWAMDQGTRIVNHWGMFYQPTTLVREYFGDHVALYFAWLQMYTRWLRFAAALGALTMVGNYLSPDGIDSNPLVLAYSIFLSLWSTLFNEAWLYRQKELQFLWGTAGYEDNEQPRPQFRGVVEEDEVTGRKALVHENPSQHAGRMLASIFMMLIMIVLVIFGALGAFIIRHTDATITEKCFNPCTSVEMAWHSTRMDDNWADYVFLSEKETQCSHVFQNSSGMAFCKFSLPNAGQEYGRCQAQEFWTNATQCENVDLDGTVTSSDRAACVRISSCSYTSYSVGGVEDPSWWQANRWKLYSSLVNLILIQGGGQVYAYLAGILNYWENHRTETEYTDNLIAKTMMFQFINNYFTLFYIAFLINIQFYPGMQTGCDGKSCMAELQWQLLIVFTGKTVAKKAVEMAKPFVHGFCESRKTKKVAQKQSRKDKKAAQRQQAAAAAAAAADAGVASGAYTQRRAAVASKAAGGPAAAAAAAAAADLDLDHFTEPCEKERYLAEYGEDRYPGTFGDFQVRSPQLPPQCQWHAPLTVLTGDAIG